MRAFRNVYWIFSFLNAVALKATLPGHQVIWGLTVQRKLTASYPRIKSLLCDDDILAENFQSCCVIIKIDLKEQLSSIKGLLCAKHRAKGFHPHRFIQASEEAFKVVETMQRVSTIRWYVLGRWLRQNVNQVYRILISLPFQVHRATLWKTLSRVAHNTAGAGGNTCLVEWNGGL